MKTYEFKAEQFLNVSLREAWDFFSSPHNLAVITPPALGFKVLTKLTDEPVCAGLIIDYTVTPLYGIPLRWKTLISEVEELKYFVDLQLKGPYKLWEHRHTFTEQDNGVLMHDHVRYQLPFGLIGQLAHPILVKRKIEEIFNFRKQKLDELFGRNNRK